MSIIVIIIFGSILVIMSYDDIDLTTVTINGTVSDNSCIITILGIHNRERESNGLYSSITVIDQWSL